MNIYKAIFLGITMQTKLIALDVYGTVLRSDDYDNEMPPRKGFKEFVNICISKNIYLVTASDAPIDILKIDLEESLKKGNIKLDIFDDFFRLQYYPKDFSGIVSNYGINPIELFVIGDQYDKDIAGALRLGCNTLQVPEYNSIKDNFDFSNIIIP